MRAILVGNRYEKHDRDIVDHWSREKEGSEKDGDYIQFSLCRLPAAFLRARAAQLSSADAPHMASVNVERLHWWYASARFLFSDDLLTFRNCEAVLEAIARPSAVSDLQAELLKKSESLGELTCREFSAAVFDLYRKCNAGFSEAERLSLDPSRPFAVADKCRVIRLLADKEDNPFRLLVRTALLACFAARAVSLWCAC